MPICLRCNQNFPNRKWIDGKYRIFSSRKYCLECSPFGGHNTTKINDFPEKAYKRMGDEIICSGCGKKYVYNRSKGHGKSICNSCWTSKRKYKIKKRAIEYKGGKCQFCGYDKCLDALTFHHVDPSIKIFSIAGSYNRSWEKLKNELDKCVLLCVRCHMEEEYRLRRVKNEEN